MRFSSALIVVEKIDRSRRFYETVLKQRVKYDFGENIVFEGGFSLQSKDTWRDFIDRRNIRVLTKSHSFELYFEEEHFDAFLLYLSSFPEVELVHATKIHPWGQRVVRLYDPDGHIIEIGEDMRSVVMRFSRAGMSAEEVAKRSQYPIEFVLSCIDSPDHVEYK